MPNKCQPHDSQSVKPGKPPDPAGRLTVRSSASAICSQYCQSRYILAWGLPTQLLAVPSFARPQHAALPVFLDSHFLRTLSSQLRTLPKLGHIPTLSSLSGGTWTYQLAFLGLSFLSYKMGAIIVPITQVKCNEEIQIEKLEQSEGLISVPYHWVVKPYYVLQKCKLTLTAQLWGLC